MASSDRHDETVNPATLDSTLITDFALTQESFVRRVAIALCREWGLDPDGQVTIFNGDPVDLSNWETFKLESRAAIHAYLSALDEQDYRITGPATADH